MLHYLLVSGLFTPLILLLGVVFCGIGVFVRILGRKRSGTFFFVPAFGCFGAALGYHLGNFCTSLFGFPVDGPPNLWFFGFVLGGILGALAGVWNLMGCFRVVTSDGEGRR